MLFFSQKVEVRWYDTKQITGILLYLETGSWRVHMWWFNSLNEVPEKFMCWEIQRRDVRRCLRKIMNLWHNILMLYLMLEVKTSWWNQSHANFFFSVALFVWLGCASKGSRGWDFSKLERSSKEGHNRRTGKPGSWMLITEQFRLYTIGFKWIRKLVRVRIGWKTLHFLCQVWSPI